MSLTFYLPTLTLDINQSPLKQLTMPKTIIINTNIVRIRQTMTIHSHYSQFCLKITTLTLYLVTLTLKSVKITINRLGLPKTIKNHVNLIQITQLLTDIYQYKDLAYVYGGHFEFRRFLRGYRQKKIWTVKFYLCGPIKVGLQKIWCLVPEVEIGQIWPLPIPLLIWIWISREILVLQTSWCTPWNWNLMWHSHIDRPQHYMLI